MIGKPAFTALKQVFAVYTIAALLLTPAFSALTPSFAYADDPTTEEECTLAGGTWNGTSCDLPETTPTPEEQCGLDGGTWNGTSCDMPPTPEEQCTLDGGTWNGTSCDIPS
ncbi:hypothetical protein C4585_00825, partial [Candidatus Parcubacteria bacterium]